MVPIIFFSVIGVKGVRWHINNELCPMTKYYVWKRKLITLNLRNLRDIFEKMKVIGYKRKFVDSLGRIVNNFWIYLEITPKSITCGGGSKKRGRNDVVF